ncbi:serine/threonine-protein kinase-like protein At3g51990 [Ipomoea triloba]|uniref:serine/threonine-protein kinase-like protein At3g51990 n=1 Tax=Ipomoea triloba TaxID=35885 RepID=UPI00125E616D|nr:serine/threonine-protein kinase-like protein At3g51990 [Ipomoea triloba]
MGFLSCNAETAIATCDSYNWEHLKKKKKKKCELTRPFELREFSYADLHAATNGFSQENLLGKGSHGFVYRATLPQGRRSFVAAVKITKQSEAFASFSAGSPAENEIELLSRVYHPRLVNLLGYGFHLDQKKLLVVEFMPNGSLYELLHCPKRPPRIPGLYLRVRFALQVAKAVHFCHVSNPPVIHRDIKSSNVLIDAKFNARLGDFGLALMGHVEDVAAKCTPPAGTLGYLDPGYLAPGDLSTKSDVFSFGILLMEIISGRNAIDMNYSPPSVVDWVVPLVKSGNYAEILDPRIDTPEDDGILRHLAVLSAQCVRKTAAKRPTMAEVVDSLTAVYKRLNSPIWNTIRRRVDCVRDSTRVAARYEPLDDSMEAVKISRAGSRRTRKVSSITTVEAGSNLIGGKSIHHAVKAKSIGSFAEIGYEPLDPISNQVGPGMGPRSVGFGTKMPTVRLSKSRSMGMMNSTDTRVKNPNGNELEESKLLVDQVRGTLKENS